MRVATFCLVLLLVASPLIAVEATGRVVDGNGRGVVLVEVNFMKSGGNSIVAGGWTDDSGYFSVDVASGTYDVVVEDPKTGKRQRFNAVKVEQDGSLSRSEFKFTS